MLEQVREARQRARDRKTLQAVRASCITLIGERGEANSVKFARTAIEQYHELSQAGKGAFFRMLADEFAPDSATVVASAQRYAQTRSAESLLELLRVVEPPRQELLRRINRAPQGTATILHMRRELLQEIRSNPHLVQVEADFHHLLSSWFNPGFLRLERVDWRSPARLLEQIIHHEAVHEIQGWDDLRRRLEPDRRCFAFFHPALPDDPLVFVEVALTRDMPADIGPLLRDALDANIDRARFAVFYSISNCQPGLRGVSLGNFLIKQVCEVLRAEFPKLRQYCTLSPVPGFARWLRNGAEVDGLALTSAAAARLGQSLAKVRSLLVEAAGDDAALQAASTIQRESLLRLCAAYLLRTRNHDEKSDPVARFHLGNGAALYRINFLANPTQRGLDESIGIMVNYLYDLGDIETNHQDFVRGRIAMSREVRGLI